jgi:hypothetical protein
MGHCKSPNHPQFNRNHAVAKLLHLALDMRHLMAISHQAFITFNGLLLSVLFIIVKGMHFSMYSCGRGDSCPWQHPILTI